MTLPPLIHLPAAAWGVLIEFSGWICPLTPWEQALQAKAGQVGYGGGFIDHYILPILCPQGLTPDVQFGQVGVRRRSGEVPSG